MSRRLSSSLLAALVAISLVVPVPAAAQVRRNGVQSDARRVPYDLGYRDGVEQGREDARARRAYEIERHRAYRDGDRGYDRRFGNRADYRRLYREGFSIGYRQGYGVADRGRRPRAVPRDGRSPLPPVHGGANRGRFPRSDRYGRQAPAYDNGFSDGYEQGLDDGEDGDRFDPVRHGRYRNGDRGYNSRYGSRSEYKNLYRVGYREGYEQGYYDARRYGRGGRSSGGWF